MLYEADKQGIRGIEDIIYGNSRKRPPKWRFWALFFAACFLALVFLVLFNALAAQAQVNVIISQQDSTASSTITSSFGQGNFDYLFNGTAFTATSTFTSLTLMLGYGGATDLIHGGSLAGQTHRICFYTLGTATGVNAVGAVVAATGSTLIEPLGCLSRTITSNDIATTTPQQKTFTGSVSLPPNDSTTSQPTYLFTSFGTMSATSTNPSDWGNSITGLKVWGTPNQGLGGAIPRATDGVIIADFPPLQGEFQSFSSSFPASNLQNLFFILNGNVPIGGTGGINYTSCEGGGVFDNLLCNLYVSLFIPSNEALLQFDGLFDTIENKPPFGYFTQIKNAINNLGVGTTTLAFAGVSELGVIFDPIRTALIFGLWFLFIIWIFHRLRLFEF